jgi:cysteine synthase A
MIHSQALELIGNTPVVRLNNLLEAGYASLYAKLEGFNPGGSSKDRAAKGMIEAAERDGKLRPGGTIIESSSGNLAIGLALVARLKEYKAICVVDPKISDVNLSIIRALGADTHMVREADENGSYLMARINAAKALAESHDNSFWTNQYNNPDSPEAYRSTMAQEIYEDFAEDLDWVVLPTGTAGLATGCSLGLKERIPGVEIMAVDAEGSVIFGAPPGKRLLTGIGAAIVPGNLRPELYDEVVHVGDAPAFRTTRLLASREGLLVGGSSGAVVYAAMELAQTLPPSRTVLAVLPDRGDRYFNTIFSDEWLAHNGIDLTAVPVD